MIDFCIEMVYLIIGNNDPSDTDAWPKEKVFLHAYFSKDWNNITCDPFGYSSIMQLKYFDVTGNWKDLMYALVEPYENAIDYSHAKELIEDFDELYTEAISDEEMLEIIKNDQRFDGMLKRQQRCD